MLLGKSSDESSSFFSLLDELKSPKRSSKGSPTLALLDAELEVSSQRDFKKEAKQSMR